MGEFLRAECSNTLPRCTLISVLLFVSISSVSCTSQIPVATNYPYAEQQKMQAAHHWQVLAADVVNQMKQGGRIPKDASFFVVSEFYPPDKKAPTVRTTAAPLTVADKPCRLATIPFKRAYRSYLITQLVNAGYNVVGDAMVAKLVITFDIQLVEHNDRAVRSPDIISRIGRLFAGSIDGAYEGVDATKYEVIITTSVKDRDIYVMSHTNTYYINAPLWNNNYTTQGKVMEVVDQ